MTHALTIDLEDWYCVGNLRHILPPSTWCGLHTRIEQTTHRILQLLEHKNVEATFFVLGRIAQRHPGLLKTIVAAGHEIALHGYDHTPVTDLTPEAFAADIQLTRDVVESIASVRTEGYRAPSFTITKQTIWALDVLRECGLRYDSSVMPRGMHPVYGVAGASSAIHRDPSGLLEVPPCGPSFVNRSIPCGGAWFRFFPYKVTSQLIRSCARQGRPAIFYIHPWEIDPDTPDIDCSTIRRIRQYHNLATTYSRLERLISEFRFTSIRRIIGNL